MLLGGSWRNSSIPPESDFCFGSIQPWWWFIEKGQRVFFQDHISICSYSTIQKLFTPTCLQDVEKNHSYKSALKMPWFHSKYLCDRRRSWRTWTHALWRCNGEDVREVTTGGSNGFQILWDNPIQIIQSDRKSLHDSIPSGSVEDDEVKASSRGCTNYLKKHAHIDPYSIWYNRH